MAIKTKDEVLSLVASAPNLNERIPTNGRLARLLAVPDKAGKTRTVYCLTWWVQEILHSFHMDLYSLLYTIKEDGTRSHRERAQ